MILLIFSLIFSLNISKLKGPKRPSKIFATIINKGKRDIALINRITGKQTMFTSDSTPETALMCASGKLIYVSGNKIYWQNFSKPKFPNFIGTLPNGLIMSQVDNLRHFIKLSNYRKMILFPKSVGFRIKSFDNKVDLTVIPPIGEKVIHPAYWKPDDSEVFFATLNKQGQLIFRFKTLYPYKDRLVIQAYPKPIKSVLSMEAFWSFDGKRLAINMDVEIQKKTKRNKTKQKSKRLFFLLDTNGGKYVKLIKYWKLYKFHGFNNKNELILTMNKSRSVRIYRLNLDKGLKLRVIDKLYGRDVYDFFPSRRSFILYSQWKRCKKPRLYSINMYGKEKRLLRWTKWSEVIALDEYKTWALLRGADSCRSRRLFLYLMRVDGILIYDISKRITKKIKFLMPEQVALCH